MPEYVTVEKGDEVECPECGEVQEMIAGMLSEGELKCAHCGEIVGTAGEPAEEFAKIRVPESD